jgi:hypothetical protein
MSSLIEKFQWHGTLRYNTNAIRFAKIFGFVFRRVEGSGRLAFADIAPRVFKRISWLEILQGWDTRFEYVLMSTVDMTTAADVEKELNEYNQWAMREDAHVNERRTRFALHNVYNVNNDGDPTDLNVVSIVDRRTLSTDVGWRVIQSARADGVNKYVRNPSFGNRADILSSNPGQFTVGVICIHSL